MRFLPSRIAMRIPMGFGAMLVIALIIAAVGFVNILRLSDGFTRYEAVRDYSAQVNKVAILFSELRGTAAAYVAGANSDDADRFNATAGELRNELAGLAQKVTNDEGRAAIGNLLTEMDSFEGNFAQLTSLVSMRNNARGRMDTQGEQMVGVLSTAMIRLSDEIAYQDAALLGQLQEKLMRALLEATRMRSAYSPETMQNAQAAFDALEKGVKDISRQVGDPVAYEAMTTLTKAMADYASAFERSVAMTAKLEDVGRTSNEEIGGRINAEMARLLDLQQNQMASERERAFDTVYLAEAFIVAAAVVALLLGILLSYVTTRSLVPPLRALTGALDRLARRDWATDVPGQQRRDELGEIARAVDVFKQNGIESDRLAEQQAAENAAKLARQARIEQAIGAFESAVGSALGALTGSAGELDRTAQGMSSLAEQTSGRATAVAAAAEQAAANVQTVAASSEELYASVEEIGRQVTSSTEIAEEANRQAETAGGRVQSLAEAAERIGDVVQLISDIAGQTNLLALNATIESARAGEAGKGFAVVASEVKNLAGQTGKATEDIARQIEAIQSETRETVTAIADIRKTIVQVSEITTAIASAVQQQSAATAEISRNVQQASAGTQEVTSNIVTVSEAAVQTGEGARSVLGSSATLSEQSKILRHEVDRFLESIRTA